MAIATQLEDSAGGSSATKLPIWRSTLADHVIFRLVDAERLLPPLGDTLGVVLGGREVEEARPDHYVSADGSA